MMAEEFVDTTVVKDEEEGEESEETPSEKTVASSTPQPPAQKPQIDPDQLYKLFGPSIEQGVKRSEGTWYHPFSKFAMIVIQDPKFRVAAADIYSKFDRNTLLGYEIGWLVIIWILRAWRLSKAQTWLTRLGVQAVLSLLFSFGTAFLIPWLIWGDSYGTILSSCLRALIHQIWA